jgi:hypothetical protein
MAAVRAAARPWYQREWLTWPAAWQLLSGMALVSLVIGLRLLLPDVQTAVGEEVTQVVAPVIAPISDATARLEGLGIAARVFWRALQPIPGLLLVLMLIMCGACAAFGLALSRLTLGGALRS